MYQTIIVIEISQQELALDKQIDLCGIGIMICSTKNFYDNINMHLEIFILYVSHSQLKFIFIFSCYNIYKIRFLDLLILLKVYSNQMKGTLLLNNAVAFTCTALQGCSKVSKSFEVLIAGHVVAGICCVSCLEGCDVITLMTCLIPLCCILSRIDQWTHNTSPTIPAIYSLVTLTFCPESPKYLLVNKRDDDGADAALIWLRKTSDVSEEMKAMKKERQDLRNSPKVVYYSTSIFISAGLSKETSQYARVATGVVKVMMTFISALIMDRAGRRSLHMIGLVGMCISSVVLVVCLSLQKTLPWLSYISIVAVIIYTCLFATGPGPILWFMVTEMFAQGQRSAAVSVFVVINWLCNFAVGLVFPILQKSLETYFLSAFLHHAVVVLHFHLYVCPKGKSISEITQLFKSPTMDRSESRNSYKSSKNRYSTQVLIIDPPLSEKGTEYYIESSYL
ncbi:solute carrier family 2, facilitated glucose transporter member 1-like isoform X1 [Biomphalaria glabrata]|uniref:Solute carrier family 2, facilitated glucose transporter member 1-like isoform X1 n=1 Tax=Biomphalaria glabrata TaxID=6526 RepID=A0A9W3AF14_BIOGL|nr:solute carrier family 2, facilitated glucose transporter member 1-like isoform X1 [Biomphalaria glabrata]